MQFYSIVVSFKEKEITSVGWWNEEAQEVVGGSLELVYVKAVSIPKIFHDTLCCLARRSRAHLLCPTESPLQWPVYASSFLYNEDF